MPTSGVLVDDSPDVRRLLSTRLELEGGFEVVGEAADGAEAIVLATRHQPDLIVLDAMMPVLTGLDALPAIVKGSPASKVVVYSAFTDDPALETDLRRRRPRRRQQVGADRPAAAGDRRRAAGGVAAVRRCAHVGPAGIEPATQGL